MVVVAPSQNWVRQVRRFVQPHAVARCELCGAAIPETHAHLVDTVGRHLLCACSGCAATAERTDARFRRLPARARRLEDFRLTDAEWEALQIPIGLAFMFHSTPQGRVIALYPVRLAPPNLCCRSMAGRSWSPATRRSPRLIRMSRRC